MTIRTLRRVISRGRINALILLASILVQSCWLGSDDRDSNPTQRNLIVGEESDVADTVAGFNNSAKLVGQIVNLETTLVLWQEESASGGHLIRGIRVRDNTSIDGFGKTILTVSNEISPLLLENHEQGFVLFYGIKVYEESGASFNIFRVELDAALAQLSSSLLHTFTGQDFDEIKLRWTGSCYLLVWTGSQSDLDTLQAFRFSPMGQPIDEFPFIYVNGSCFDLDLAVCQNRVFVVYNRMTGSPFEYTQMNLYGLLLDGYGVPLSGSSVPLTSKPRITTPTLTSDDESFFLTYASRQDDLDAGHDSNTLFGMMISPSGEIQVPGAVVLNEFFYFAGDGRMPFVSRPFVAPFDGGFLCIANSGFDTTDALYVRHDLTTIEQVDVSYPGTLHSFPSGLLTSSGGFQILFQLWGCIFAYHPECVDKYMMVSYTNLYSSSGSLPLVTIANSTKTPILGGSGQGELLIWTDNRDRIPNEGDLYSTRLDLLANPLDSPDRGLAVLQYSQESIGIVAGQGTWLVGLKTEYNGGPSSYFKASYALFDENLRSLTAWSDPLTSLEYGESDVAFTGDGNRFMVFYRRHASGGFDILGRVIGSDGILSAVENTILHLGGGQSDWLMDAAYLNGVYLLTLSLGNRIEGVMLDAASGEILRPMFRIATAATYIDLRLDLIAGSENFLVAWREFDEQNLPTPVRATRVSLTGQVLDDPPVEVSPRPGAGWKSKEGPRIAWDGRDYLVVWPSQEFVGADLHTQLWGTRLLADLNVLDPEGIFIHDNGTSYVGPSATLTAVSMGNFIVAYERYDERTDYGTRRVKIRRLHE